MNLIETGHHEVNAYCYPYLVAHCVFRGAEESFDPQVLLDPFEEELDLPAALVGGSDGQGGQVEVVGQEVEALTACRVEITNTTEPFWVIELPGFWSRSKAACLETAPYL